MNERLFEFKIVALSLINIMIYHFSSVTYHLKSSLQKSLTWNNKTTKHLKDCLKLRTFLKRAVILQLFLNSPL